MSYSIPAHPAATIFPLMDGVELTALADDIRAHGLLDPIVMLDGQVLDGRNRLRACELAGVTPSFVEWGQNGSSPTEWVVSHNLHRRHLTTGQRAALALDLLPRLEAEARERQSLAGGARPGPLPPESEEAKGEATEKAASLVGVGRSTVAAAKAIQKRDESGDVVQAMRAGDLSIEAAKRRTGFARDEVLGDGAIDRAGREMPVYYGKGDKWFEAAGPLKRYLDAWEKRAYRFGHVNYREATKRVRLIDELTEKLAAAREDLEIRSHKPRPFSPK